MDDLKSRFDAAAEGIVPPSPSLERVMRHGRRNRLWRGVAAMAATCLLVAAAVVGSVTILTSDNEVAGSGDGYVFRFEILGYDPAPNHVRVRYTSEWATEEYPGVRDCIWKLYRDDGSFISDWEYNISAQHMRRVSRTDEITAPELPEYIEASCGPRLDHGRFKVVSEPVVEKRRLGTHEEWVLAFDLKWYGTRVRGSTDCHWQIYSQDGTEVVKRGVQGVGGGEGSDVLEIVVRLSRGFKNPPGEAQVECVPFGEEQPKSRVEVPDLTGLTIAEARRTLDEVGLEATFMEEENPEFAAGIVSGQTPAPGTEVESGTQVLLTVSTGPDTSTTPSFARFATRYPETRRNPQEVIGTVEIDAEAGTICSTAYLPWARAAQIHMKVPDTEFPGADPILITIFEPPTDFRATICRDTDSTKLLEILGDPGGFYIDYHERDAGGKEARSELGVNLIGDPERDSR